MEEAILLLAHFGNLHPGLNLPFVMYSGQVALCAGFTYWCLRIIVARRSPEDDREHDHQRDDVDGHHDAAPELLVVDRRWPAGARPGPVPARVEGRLRD